MIHCFARLKYHLRLLLHIPLFTSIVALNKVAIFKSFYRRSVVSRGFRCDFPVFSLRMTPPASSVLESPSAERNKGPIWDALFHKVLPVVGTISRVVEIAAGCGVHTIYFASQLHNHQQNQSFSWLPTDPDYASRLSIDERVRVCSDNRLKACIQPAQALTLNEQGSEEHFDWSNTHGGLDLIISINLIHISPWSASIGLMRTASQLLKMGGVLYCYGPYKEGGTAVESNLAFDQSLRSRNPSWGVRNLEDVILLAAEYGLVLNERVQMPANNLSVIFVKK
mmetsp:Transcript_24297/g.34835  ORF Transcript_24297/g.34835 Transcript_24297/m.34835 type:complete len:281 (-) Transcript_24297:1884-2726(-)